MKAEESIQLLKFFFQVFNFILLLLGISVLSCSLWILFSSGNLLNILPSEDVRVLGYGLLGIGGLVMLVCVLGCIGAHSQKRLLLMVYLGLLIVLILGQLFVALLLIINRDKIGVSLDETVDQLISQYGPDRTGPNRLLDSIQRQGRCCGRMGPSDWLTNSIIQNRTDLLPCSCFNSSQSSSSLWCPNNVSVPELLVAQGDGLYEQGCETSISDWLQQNVLTIAGMSFGLVFIQVIQAFVAGYLSHVIGRRAASTGSRILDDSDHAYLDPTPEDVEEELNSPGYMHRPASKSL